MGELTIEEEDSGECCDEHDRTDNAGSQEGDSGA